MEKIFLVIFGALACLCAIMNAPGLFYFLSITLLVWFLINRYCPQDDRKLISRVFIIGIMLKCAIAVIFYWSLIIRGEFYRSFVHAFSSFEWKAGVLFNDEFAYTMAGWEIKRFLAGEIIEKQLYFFMNGYLYWTALIYTLFGYVPLVIKLYNCLFSVIVAGLAYLIAREIFDRKVARIACIFVAFSPSLLLWSVTNLKDILNLLCFSVMFWGVIKFLNEARFKWFLILLLSAGMAISIRKDMTYLIAAFLIIITIAYLAKTRFFLSRFRKVIFLFLLFGLFCFALIVKGKTVEAQYDKFTYQFIHKQRGNISMGGHVYRIYPSEYYNNPGKKMSIVELSKSFVRGTINFFLSPFPWETLTLMELIYYPQVLIGYFFIPFTALGVLAGARNNNKARILLLFIILISLPMVLTDANVGTVVRHRDLIFPFMYIFTAAGLQRVCGRK